VSGLGTHEKGAQHGCEQDSIVIPERTCSEGEKAWINQISDIYTLGKRDIPSEQTTDSIPKPVRRWFVLIMAVHR
jgi:hypothetical protein